MKELKELPMMATGELPPTVCPKQAEKRRQKLHIDFLAPLQRLSDVCADTLKKIIEAQRKRFAKGGKKDDDVPEDENVPPEDNRANAPQHAARLSEPVAAFAPSAEFQRPSDYIKHLTRQFEAGKVNPTTGHVERRPLKRDQALFISHFASACNAVWDDEQKLIDGSLDAKSRRCFQFLLMGQGGSGKTAVVQEIVLPAMDSLFPTEPEEVNSTLIVCAKWSQAENISTADHKAVTFHRAALLGVQSYRNKEMLAKDKKAALKRTWEPRRCLIIEEVSMISPNLYNMLAYRAFLGRADRWQVDEQDYDQLKGAFGRMPIVIHLGDFLQLKPTATNVSLIDDFRRLADAGVELAPEFQSVMKLF